MDTPICCNRFIKLYELNFDDDNDTQINRDFIEIFSKILINFSRNIFKPKSNWKTVNPTTMKISDDLDIYEYGKKIIDIQSQLTHFIKRFKFHNMFVKENMKKSISDEYLTFVKETIIFLCNEIIDIIPSLKYKLFNIISKYKKENTVIKSKKLNYEALNKIISGDSKIINKSYV